CPECHRQLQVEWEDHEGERICPGCRHRHFPPTPGEDPLAFIGGDRWPPEMEQAVVTLRGTTCDVPGCYHAYETLGLRKPASRGGRLSVDNLIPMCHFHARLKGEQDYESWVRELSPEERAGAAPEFEIVFTEEKPEPKRPAAAPRPPPPPPTPRKAYPLTGRARGPVELPPGLQLVALQPFPARNWRRLALSYRCRLAGNGGCRVILAAWPCARPPDWKREPTGPARASREGGEGVLLAETSYEGGDATCREGRLELDLSGVTGDELWTAAVLLGSSGGRPELTDYLLAGED
ncbi:MAG: hypothetical protein R6X14_10145, partial [bacterium]